MAIQYIYFKHSFVYQIRIYLYYSVPTIHEYQWPKIFVSEKFPKTEDRISSFLKNFRRPKTEYLRSWKFPKTEDRIVLFGPNYSRIPKNRSIRCNSDLNIIYATSECITSELIAIFSWQGAFLKLFIPKIFQCNWS